MGITGAEAVNQDQLCLVNILENEGLLGGCTMGPEHLLWSLAVLTTGFSFAERVGMREISQAVEVRAGFKVQPLDS